MNINPDTIRTARQATQYLEQIPATLRGIAGWSIARHRDEISRAFGLTRSELDTIMDCIRMTDPSDPVLYPDCVKGPECPSCGRDNSEDGSICTSDDCPGVLGEAPPVGNPIVKGAYLYCGEMCAGSNPATPGHQMNPSDSEDEEFLQPNAHSGRCDCCGDVLEVEGETFGVFKTHDEVQTPSVREALALLIELHDHKTFICGVDDEPQVQRILAMARNALRSF